MAGETRVNFQYWAKAGNGKSVRGKRSAENEEELLEWIRDKGWIPINIARSYETVASIGDSFGKKIDWKEFFDLSPKVKLRDKAIFIRQLSTMISAGVPTEYTPDEGPLDDPYLEIPDGILSVLNYYEKGVTVEAELIDQNYSDSFLPEAERLEIPRGAPSELMLSKDGSDPDICVARRYFIRIKVFDRTREDPQLVLAESVIVVCGSAGDLHALTLCTNKQ